MRLTHALLVIVDISGYTEFITKRETSLLHAEQIITELMEAVIDRADHPLTVNKLQGDAALLYREYRPDEAGAATVDALAQLGGFFSAFDQRRGEVAEARSGCGCDACSNTLGLRLKAFVHTGEIAIKQVRQFEELAGEALIFIHRLMKNSVGEREYVLASDAIRQLAPSALDQALPHREHLDGMGEQALWLLRVDQLPALPARHPASRDPAAADILHVPGFQHLPPASGPLAWWRALRQRVFG